MRMIYMEKEVLIVAGVFALIGGMLIMQPDYMESMLYWLLLSMKPLPDAGIVQNK
jgi:hypothetical protein